MNQIESVIKEQPVCRKGHGKRLRGQAGNSMKGLDIVHQAIDAVPLTKLFREHATIGVKEVGQGGVGCDVG